MNQSIIIFGGSSGIGLAAAAEYLELGDEVTIVASTVDF